MARHRSPRGRRAHQNSSGMATGHPAVGRSAHRSVPTPIYRGAAVVAVTGGAFSLVGAASPLPVTAAPAALAVPVQSTDVLLRAAVEPVVPDPDVVDAGDLVKAVQLAEQQIARVAAERAAAEERAEQARRKAEEEKVSSAGLSSPDCGLDTSGLGAVKSYVRAAAEVLGCRFGEPTMHGVAGRAGTSDHPSGKAIDFMVDRATGDKLAACALRNQDALGISYVIWEQQINHGNGWQPMEDRGGVTANHFDHVHVSFGSGKGSGELRGC
ncbi:hypothetical protein ACQPZA_30855 [Pseudonocardia xinjiangensis]|uniref:hypothetical protein n=1 Tax=Pseudonocardia xinjiangensis TaxID=75289 RepID=UPI003D909C74